MSITICHMCQGSGDAPYFDDNRGVVDQPCQTCRGTGKIGGTSKPLRFNYVDAIDRAAAAFQAALDRKAGVDPNGAQP